MRGRYTLYIKVLGQAFRPYIRSCTCECWPAVVGAASQPLARRCHCRSLLPLACSSTPLAPGYRGGKSHSPFRGHGNHEARKCGKTVLLCATRRLGVVSRALHRSNPQCNQINVFRALFSTRVVGKTTQGCTAMLYHGTLILSVGNTPFSAEFDKVGPHRR